MKRNLAPLFVGVTRFSLYIPGAQQWNLSAGSGSEDEYRKQLFDQDRLDLRLDIFLNYSLPQLELASEGFDVVHAVQYSSLLPEKYRNSLEAAEKEYDFLKLIQSDDPQVHSDCVHQIVEERAKLCGYDVLNYAWYRLDDDDLLGTSFFDRLSEYVSPAFNGFVVSFGLGYSAFYSDGLFHNFRSLHRPKNSVGQAYICEFVAKTSSYAEANQYNHAKVDLAIPTILDSRKAGFITTLHPSQDGHDRGDGASVFGAILKEQSMLPPASVSPSFSAEFPVVKSVLENINYSLVIKKSVEVSTNPSIWAVEITDQLIELRFDISSDVGTQDSRIFVGFEFDEMALPVPHWPWIEFQGTQLVAGNLIANGSEIRLYLLLPKEYVGKSALLRLWHSRSYVGEIKLKNFTAVGLNG